MQLEGTTTTQSVRASTLTGAAIVVVAGAVLGAIALRDRIGLGSSTPRAVVPALVTAPASTPAASATLLAEALVTSNVYTRPDRTSEVVAVLPGGQRAAVTGRSQDAEWLYVTTPPASALRGWAPAGGLQLAGAVLAALPVVDARTVTAATPTRTPDGDLPDPALAEVLVLPGGQLAIGIRNLGPGALTEVTLMLSVTRVGRESDEVIGVLRIGPATLPAGGRATIVAPVTITEPGTYRIELNPGREVPDAQHSNNVIEASLAPGQS